MVLMSWEEQAHLTNESEYRGSIRFLLLDESSRLDQKALQTLSEFCQSLGLQLLIAAPSVERTLKGTTHHLTRGHFNGREEVVVRGRRITALDPT
jgi:chromosome condensin MukBEF ATPase and DNA-binding subunit MukB